jgi:hypothetical protein
VSRFNPRATQVLTRTDGGKLVSGAVACDQETASEPSRFFRSRVMVFLGTY